MAVVEVEAPVEVLTDTEKRARILEAAALEIEMRGATHSLLMDDLGRVCLVGAIAEAQGGSGSFGPYGLAGQAWGSSYPISMIAGCHDASMLGYGADNYDPAFVLRWRAEEIRDGWDA